MTSWRDLGTTSYTTEGRGLLRSCIALSLSAIAFVCAPEKSARATPFPPGAHYKPLCPSADASGRRCYGQILVDADDKPISDATSPPGGWTPTELEQAYGLPATGGNGKIIATYIGNHYTNAEADMGTYRSKFGMSPCTKANGCFMEVTDNGGTDFSGLTDDGCSGFIGEFSLDMDMLMAGCPDCKILLIEGSDHATAIATAAKLGAVSMSMSWGYGASVSDCEVYKPPPGLTLFGASGDNGYTTSPGAPAECTHVIAVGWTQLATDSSARGYADTIPSGWGSAGGCSSIIAKGAWQPDPSCSTRMVSDISANGDNVAAYCTSPAGSADWHVTGGSSASSPFTSGVLAMLGITSVPGFDASWLYANQKKFWDVTSGGPVSNCPGGSPDYYCNAVPGYDGPTGVGTPYAPGLKIEIDAGTDAGSVLDAGGGTDAGAAHDAAGGTDATVAVDAAIGEDGGVAPSPGSDDAGTPNADTTSTGAPLGCGCTVVGRDVPHPAGLLGGLFAILGGAGMRRRRRRDGPPGVAAS